MQQHIATPTGQTFTVYGEPDYLREYTRVLIERTDREGDQFRQSVDWEAVKVALYANDYRTALALIQSA
jgi:hypothetical protein